MDEAILSRQQIADYTREGCLVVRDFYSAEEILQISAWASEIKNYPETPGKYTMYFEQSLDDPNRRIINRIENYCPYHDGFDTLARHSRLTDFVDRLFGEASVLFKDKINFKMPGGDGFAPHQDVQAGWDAYAKLHVTALVSIDHATRENGCLEIAARPNKQELVGESWRPLGEEDTAGMTFEPVNTRPGDVIFFDSFVPHRSGPNHGDAPRRVLYVTYNRLSEGDHRAQYYADKRKSYPQDCEREEGKDYVYRV